MVLGAIGLVLAGVGRERASAADRDCSDFSSQAEAQRYFDARGGAPNKNVDNLDGDGDGRACETLPCPCAASAGPGTPPASPNGRRALGARVLRAVDGDTLEARLRGGATVDVRLIGIDTPETKRPGTPIECGGPQASALMDRMARGRGVRLITDPSQDRKDRYGRLLAYAVRRDGLDLGRAIVRRGWAAVYVYEEPFERLAGFRQAQARARSEGLGVWGLCGGSFHDGS